MKIAKLFWTSGSILINFTIGIYIWLSSGAPAGLADRYEYVNANWSAYNYHWKAEFLIMSLIAVAAFYFAAKFRKTEWFIVAVGQIIALGIYPVMLGAYRNTSTEIFAAATQISTVMFVFGKGVFFGGLCVIYCRDNVLPKWLARVSAALALIVCTAFMGTFIDLWVWKQALVVAPLATVVYFINAYYGFKLSEQFYLKNDYSK